MSAISLGSITQRRAPWSPFGSSECSSSGTDRSGSRVASCRAGDHQDVVDPAATASSTTYWIAGLSTTGSISFGMRLGGGKESGAEPGCRDDGLTGGSGHAIDRNAAM